MEIGKNIARLRREQHLTQEQLGQAVGVSPQAISKWENGGTPDVELLPRIADQLGVTIDALFGREASEEQDITVSLYRWLASVPPEQRLWELFCLLSRAFFRPSITDNQVGQILEDLHTSHLPSKTCYSTDLIAGVEDTIWLRCALYLSQGLQLGVLSENCPMYLLMPEPEGGYASNFADNTQYQQLFSTLSMPGVLEILRYLYAQKLVYFSVKAIQEDLPLSPEETQAAILAMEKIHLLSGMEVRLEDGLVPVYILHSSDAYVPFMMFARWLSEEHDAFLTRWETRDRPILQKQEASHEADTK